MSKEGNTKQLEIPGCGGSISPLMLRNSWSWSWVDYLWCFMIYSTGDVMGLVRGSGNFFSSDFESRWADDNYDWTWFSFSDIKKRCFVWQNIVRMYTRPAFAIITSDLIVYDLLSGGWLNLVCPKGCLVLHKVLERKRVVFMIYIVLFWLKSEMYQYNLQLVI